MSLTLNPVSQNPAGPGNAALTLAFDKLIAGVLQPITNPVIVASGAAVLARGTVMGLVTATGKFVASLPSAVDGSQFPVGVLADITDPTAGDANSAVHLTGEFNANALSYGTWSLSALTAALRQLQIIVKTVPLALSDASAT